jgi:hypothetical protein
MKFQILALLLVGFIFQDTIGQDRVDIKRNLIKGTFATSGILNGMISIDFERNLVFSDIYKLNLEGTYGKYYQIHVKEAFQSYPTFNSITSCINSLVGRKSHFLEISTGVRYSIIKVDYYDDIKPFFPVLNIGYRFQNYYKTGLIFRAFLGTTGFGMSTGITF